MKRSNIHYRFGNIYLPMPETFQPHFLQLFLLPKKGEGIFLDYFCFLSINMLTKPMIIATATSTIKTMSIIVYSGTTVGSG
jgi:hypothetical protein